MFSACVTKNDQIQNCYNSRLQACHLFLVNNFESKFSHFYRFHDHV